MNKNSSNVSVVDLVKFIQSGRDAGYKSIVFALAELVDNSIEARAQKVEIRMHKGPDENLEFEIIDDGIGMKPSELREALRFGGSGRFNSRSGLGRFGMGLPNSSISQARRVEVITWQSSGNIWTCHLDIDEIVIGAANSIATPVRSRKSRGWPGWSESGTIVRWRKCDRVEERNVDRITRLLSRHFGRIYCRHLKDGLKLLINGLETQAFDPMFLDNRSDSGTGKLYGPPLVYSFRTTRMPDRLESSSVTVRFSELPIKRLHGLPNNEKRSLGIVKGAGVSILRSGREIDHGWYFMGKKRKENYDDWWRCQIEFEPELDELFGVANTKQGVRPGKFIQSVLAPDIERIAYQLNRRVQRTFASLKTNEHRSGSASRAADRDPLLEPATNIIGNKRRKSSPGARDVRDGRLSNLIKGLNYKFERRHGISESFFVPKLVGNDLVVTLSEDHPFYNKVYSTPSSVGPERIQSLVEVVELMMLAFARAEVAISGKGVDVRAVRKEWSKVLASFLD